MSERETRLSGGDPAEERIPREEWERFLHRFNEFNADMPVRVEVTGRGGAGCRILAENQPLLDVTLDDEAGVPLILIECGDPAAPPASRGRPEALRHAVREPVTLRARKMEPVGWEALEIEGGDETVIVSLGPHPASVPPQEDAGKELLQAGWRARLAPES